MPLNKETKPNLYVLNTGNKYIFIVEYITVKLLL